MHATTTPNAARGEVSLLIAGQPLKVRFNLRTLHDFTTTNGISIDAIGHLVTTEPFGTVAGLVASAVRCATGKPFTVGEAFDALEDMTEAQNQEVMAALVQAIRINQSPSFKALMTQLPQQSAPESTGDNSLTSASAS